MSVTNYYAVGGLLVGEAQGNSLIYYHPDRLGNVVATSTTPGTLQNRYLYTPYGQVQLQTGSDPEPGFLWVGEQGYRVSRSGASDTYVRARHYLQTTVAWTTVDPKWPKEPAFCYVGGRPTSYIDPSGLDKLTCADCEGRCIDGVNTWLAEEIALITAIAGACCIGCAPCCPACTAAALIAIMFTVYDGAQMKQQCYDCRDICTDRSASMCPACKCWCNKFY